MVTRREPLLPLCPAPCMAYDRTMSAVAKTYTAAEKRLDSAVHVVGLGLALLAVPLLIGAALVRALDTGSGSFVVAVTIYGASFLGMLGASALFNMGVNPALNWLFQRIDHAAIYVKIAGTYTPFTLITGQGLGLLAGLWGAAAVGVALKIVSPLRFRVLALGLYLGMGWVGVALLPGLSASLPLSVVVLMVLGGVVYTLGVVFYLWTRLPYHFAIWHIFVLVGSFLFYAAVMAMLLSL